VYMHGNAGILVTVGQNTGVTWFTANIVFVPSNTPISAATGLPIIFTPQSSLAAIGNTPNGGTPIVGSGSQLIQGQQATMWLPVINVFSPVPVGTPVTGAIWAEYTVQSQSTVWQYAKIGTINVKAS
ncbi:MAG: hypothetical protein ACHQX1_02410, partial [Candidatus Micrarchaeales archaeon]